ncbi:MAG: exonuclease SbcCD subunit D [Pseudomonadota bacterium]
MVTFIHSADWQIGKAFARVEDPSKRALLQDERIRAIGRLGELARARDAEFIIVAGDLFESSTVPRSTVSKALSAIGALSLPVYVIPGNHDHGGVGGIWDQEYFQREQAALAPNLHLLTTFEPVELATSVLLPCPLIRRHDSDDPAAWLQHQDFDWAQFGNKPRLVIAHGSVHGFVTEPDVDEDDLTGGANNRLNLDRLPMGEIDYIALGDWHGTKAISDKAWYAGALEQDRFAKGDDYAAGNALIVTATRGEAPNVESQRTGQTNWHAIETHFYSDADLGTLKAQMDSLVGNRVDEDLVRMSLTGALSFAARDELDELLEIWRNRLIRLKLTDETTFAPTDEEIEALTKRSADPLISQVASTLMDERSTSDADEAAIAQQALRELHRLVT